MAAHNSEDIFIELGIQGRKAPELFRSAADIAASPVNGYTHVLRRAWKSFDGLLGVFSVRGRPTLYLQESIDRGRISVREQQRFWSNGVAPMLVRVTPDEVQVYSGLRTPALPGEHVDENERLVETFERTARALELRQFIRSVEAGTVYGQYPEHFDPTQAVDQRLVQNLRATRNLMSAGKNAPDLPTIHRLLGRVLFTCYLEARGALVERDFGRLGAGSKATFRQILNLPDIQDVRRALVKFFRRIARYFRGNLFDEDLGTDLNELRDDDLVTLRELLNGTDLFLGQHVLPFNVYDFSVIPIETISAVYEDFIHAEGEEEQRKKGVYYTPPKLVEFTMDLSTEDKPDLTGKRTLDPGCGSGVFLVSAFNRKAEAWIRQNERARNATRAQALATILREQICGVDLSLIACQATCFSLYMAMLDCLEPPEIRRLGKDRLPLLLLRKGEKRRQNGPQTVLHGDFLASPPGLENRKFDFIVGNPPWVARGNVEEESIRLWKTTHDDNDYPVPAKQIACTFMWEVSRYLNADGRSCLLVPAGVLLGDQTDKFQAQWFKRHRVEKVVHLSDLRFFLFPGADHPTVAVRFMGGQSDTRHRIDYLVPKANHASMFDNVIAVEPEDRKSFPISELLASAGKDEAAALWMSYNWASPKDREFINRLRELPALSALVGEPSENKRWVKGQGFQPPGDSDKKKKPEDLKPPFWPPGHRFLPATNKFGLLLSLNDTVKVDPKIKLLRRLPDERLFRTPLVIVNQAVSKVAFSPFDVLFQHALQSIAGPHADRDLLRFLAASLASPLAAYFTFHLTTKSFYRGRALLNEMLRFPFPLPDEAPGAKAKDAVQAVGEAFDRMERDKRFHNLGHDQLVSETEDFVFQQVFAYFDVDADERILIEDTLGVLQEGSTPSRTTNVPALKKPNETDRVRYVETLLDSLRRWSGKNAGKLSARCALSDAAGVGVLTIMKLGGEPSYTETTASADLDKILLRLKNLAPDRYGSLVYLRNLAVLEGDRMHIVKPLTMRFWLRSAALNDADAAVSHLLTPRPRRVS